MRRKLIADGAEALKYEIRNIVKKGKELEKLTGRSVCWENIGDPIQKNFKVPQWMKDVLSELIQDDSSYGYCSSKGVLETREYLAGVTNSLNGVQINADDILFFNGLGDAISTIYSLIRRTSRVIGPSPAYSTHSSFEAAYTKGKPLLYNLDPKNGWLPIWKTFA